MGTSTVCTEYDIEDLLAFDVSDETLEAAAGVEAGPHKTGCTSYCPAYSC